MLDDLTWTCHICGDERPDRAISVHKKPISVAGKRCGTMNIRYCNDREGCTSKAPDHDFLKKVDDVE